MGRPQDGTTDDRTGPMTATVQDRIRAAHGLTRAERQIAAAIAENYPVSGLVSITRLADAAGVSSPTVARMVQKLGFAGFAEFQDALRHELEARISTPIARHDRWAADAPADHILNRFTDQVTQNIRQTIAALDPATFAATLDLLCDPDRRIHVTGGRITHVLAGYLHLHLQVCRAGVHLLRSDASSWPHGALDIGPRDVMAIYDIRRYEMATLRLAEEARARGAAIVLLTDQWRSPIERHAACVLPCRIEAPSAWDSSVALMLVTETLIAAAQERLWEGARDRMADLERIFDQGRTFRKFV